MMIGILLIVLSGLAADLEDVKTYKGKDVEFCGSIVSIRVPESDSQPSILSMEGKLDIVIWENNVESIEVLPSSLVGNTVCVNGSVEKYKEKYQITVRNHSQIRIKHNDSH